MCFCLGINNIIQKSLNIALRGAHAAEAMSRSQWTVSSAAGSWNVFSMCVNATAWYSCYKQQWVRAKYDDGNGSGFYVGANIREALWLQRHWEESQRLNCQAHTKSGMSIWYLDTWGKLNMLNTSICTGNNSVFLNYRNCFSLTVIHFLQQCKILQSQSSYFFIS